RNATRERFIQRFMKPNQRHLPFWFSFPSLQPVPHQVLFSEQRQNRETVFFMIGKGDEIRRCSGTAVAQFFANEQPCEDFDLYVFDESFTWCLASTHEMADGYTSDSDFLTLQVGDNT